MFGLLDSGSEHKTFNKKLIRSTSLVRLTDLSLAFFAVDIPGTPEHPVVRLGFYHPGGH
jgi:hypothetical protein